ncbi:MAG TPA: tripartite tricarboxylate transporter TctB family protein [Limnobacter sp.]|uniref:tripartite tricarboxylate transporter TctB family protein n=1 Tax=Limnobacter sp. TaxID=2003368 RepID=UPI002ED9F39B
MPKNLRDFWSGLLYLLVGAAAVWLGDDYPMGTAVRMGPGYFPIVLGYLLAGIGLLCVLRAFVQAGDPLEGFAWTKVAWVTVAVTAFGLIVQGAGLAAAVAAVVVLSALASRHFSWKWSVGIAVGSAVFCALVFVKGLGIPMPVIGPWLGGA